METIRKYAMRAAVAAGSLAAAAAPVLAGITVAGG